MRDRARVRVTGTLAPYAPGFVAELVAVGYRPDPATVQLRSMGQLSRWLEVRGLGPEGLSAAEAGRFLAARRAAGYGDHCSPRALEPLLGYLRGLGVVPAAEAPVQSAVELLLGRYRASLIVERGSQRARCAATSIWCGRSSRRAWMGVASWIWSG
jgi:integrase/recombinase XerD